MLSTFSMLLLSSVMSNYEKLKMKGCGERNFEMKNITENKRKNCNSWGI